MTITNIALNLSMNLILTNIKFEEYNMMLIILEVIVFVTEGIVAFLFKSVRWKGFIASICANSVSLGLGLLINNQVKNNQVFVYIAIAFGIAFLIEYVFLFWYEFSSSLDLKEKKDKQ